MSSCIEYASLKWCRLWGCPCTVVAAMCCWLCMLCTKQRSRSNYSLQIVWSKGDGVGQCRRVVGRCSQLSTTILVMGQHTAKSSSVPLRGMVVI